MAYVVDSDFTAEDARRVAYEQLDDEWDELEEWSPPEKESFISSPAAEEAQLSGDVAEKTGTGLGGYLLSALRFGWRETSAPAVPTGRELQASAYTIDQLEDILLWNDTWLTAKVFSVGLYVFICLQQLLLGTLPLQLSTVVAVACLGCLLYNIPAQLLRVLRQGPSSVEARKSTEGCQAEAVLQAEVQTVVLRCAERFAPFIAAVVGLVVRRLSGRDHLGASVWLALALWLIICMGELRVAAPATLMLWSWMGLFTAPWLYVQCRKPLDALVEEAVQVVAFLLASGNRRTVITSVGTGTLVMLMCYNMPLYISIPLSLAAFSGVMAWGVASTHAQ